MQKRSESKFPSTRTTAAFLLGTLVTLAAGGAYAQKPPPPPIKGKTYPNAKDDRTPPARVIQLKPGQKKIDPKVLKAAPTVSQFVKAKAKNPKARPVQRQISPAPPLPVGKSVGVVRPGAPVKPLSTPAQPKR